MSSEACCNFDDFWRAVADETRQHILTLLQGGEMSVGELRNHLDLTQPTVSHHLAVLHQVGLACSRRDGKYVFYRVNPACMTEQCQAVLSRFKGTVGDLNNEGGKDE